jgi:hypothetical protein
MATNQNVLFTIIPRGISTHSKTMPVSAIISPRLFGDDNLGAFPDWLNWTKNLKEKGLQLELECDGKKRKTTIDTEILRPDLWEQLFNKETLVRSYKFDDYTGHSIISYSVRDTLTALKTIYQKAGIELALPDDGTNLLEQREKGNNRDRLASLLNGLEVNWNKNEAQRWREVVRNSNRPMQNNMSRLQNSLQAFDGPLDSEGLYITEPDSAAFKKTAIPFAVFHHMPTPDPHEHELSIDTENLLDFHQVLSSLNVYPEFQRALGLVFDFELPHSFVKTTPPGSFGTLSVKSVEFNWQTSTKSPPLETAYLRLEVANNNLFFTAPRILNDPSSPPSVLGLLAMDSQKFGLAQIDVDGGMHKSIILAETIKNPGGRNLDPNTKREPAPHPDVFDADATLPSLRSGGFSLFADRRGLLLLDTLTQSKSFNDAVEGGGTQPRPFFAEDLVRGYRLDVWDSHTKKWHSLHRRNGKYVIGEDEILFETNDEEGFIQSAAVQPAEGAETDTDDFYLHEALARWSGWSLSVEQPAKHLSKHADPEKAIPPDGEDPDYLEDQPDTPFKMKVDYKVVKGSLPRLKFGTRYRIRARAVDLAGNSMAVDDPLADSLATIYALPRDSGGQAYLRYEPVIAPQIILRDKKAVTGPGSAIDRIVIRSFNDKIDKDSDEADTTAGDRHILPPRISAEMGIQLGMFDDDSGTLKSDADTWRLIAERDEGNLQELEIEIAGNTDKFPLEPDEKIDKLPFLPDLLSRGAAIRDLPGTPNDSIGRASPGDSADGQVEYKPLSDPNPRKGSATMIGFGGSSDWQKTTGFRFSLVEPAPAQTDLRPHWDPDERLLQVYLPKGQTKTVPLSSYLTTDDLKLMGVWKWIREYIDRITVINPEPRFLQPRQAVDRIAHVLQRAVEGGHWMLTPPKLITMVHAVQQPLGKPVFTPFNTDYEELSWNQNPLQTAPFSGREDPAELAPVTAWRRPDATDAYLIGALQIHGASTEKVDLMATWKDPVDNLSEKKWSVITQASHVDELILPELNEQYLVASGTKKRKVGYYDPENDQIGFVRIGDTTGLPKGKMTFYYDAAPRHLFNDTKHHVVNYTAVSTSRYQEYFPKDEDLDFTRVSDPVKVYVPASSRPLAPDVLYVVPTFGWQRQTETNLKRSVRFGGGLRVYMNRPWFSSGEGELLGVTLWSWANGSLNEENRDKFKPFFTQWGMDPIWQTGNLANVPHAGSFPDAVSHSYDVSLEESTARLPTGEHGRVSVVGFEPYFDESRGLWYADLTVVTQTDTYMPFVRLALVRYQPQALADAKISRVVLADFAQLTPTRSAIAITDPHHPKTLRVTVSGIAPRGPKPVVKGLRQVHKNPTQIFVSVQQCNPSVKSDLCWENAGSDVVTVDPQIDDYVPAQPDMVMWSGTVTFKEQPEAGRFRLLIEEYEYISANYTETEGRRNVQPGRLIYAEIFELDDALTQK